MASPVDAVNAALHLEGETLENDWTVGPLIARPPGATGGFFSVAYTVTKPDGRVGFLKVVDLATVISDIDQLQATVNDYIAERDLVLMCGRQRLSRVVTAIDHGQFQMPGYLVGGINYIIFEMASGDVRNAMSQGRLIDSIVKVDLLRHVATGLRQLHQSEVAHQDLKPSNLLVFSDLTDSQSGKIGDLGRAFRSGFPTAHDNLIRPGDVHYAPPEQLYRFTHPDEAVGRYSADLFQLGNLASYMFTTTTVNTLLLLEMPEAFRWGVFGDDFEAALPYIQEAFPRVIDSIRSNLPPEVAELAEVVAYLCNPDPELRGHPKTRRSSGNRFALQRTVSQLDLIARRASLRLARAA
jgi:serine/threonine protein kinase